MTQYSKYLIELEIFLRAFLFPKHSNFLPISHKFAIFDIAIYLIHQSIIYIFIVDVAKIMVHTLNKLAQSFYINKMAFGTNVYITRIRQNDLFI